jgi:hypothetical protein
MDMMNQAIMVCPDCQEYKMGAASGKAQMGKCDFCGKAMKEMKMM